MSDPCQDIMVVSLRIQQVDYRPSLSEAEHDFCDADPENSVTKSVGLQVSVRLLECSGGGWSFADARDIDACDTNVITLSASGEVRGRHGHHLVITSSGSGVYAATLEVSVESPFTLADVDGVPITNPSPYATTVSLGNTESTTVLTLVHSACTAQGSPIPCPDSPDPSDPPQSIACVGEGSQLFEVDSGFYWEIAPGVDLSTVLTGDQIDCHMAAMEEINAAREAEFTAAGKVIQWRSVPQWRDMTTPEVSTWWRASMLADPSVGCDTGVWETLKEDDNDWRYRGIWGKGLVTYYCLADGPPAPPVNPPDPGPTGCGAWSVAFVRPINIPFGIPTWVSWAISESFPPEVTSDLDIHLLFDGSETTVADGVRSGILEVDIPGNRVRVVLYDTAQHRLDLSVSQPDCDDPNRFDTEVLRASTDVPPVEPCVERLTSKVVEVCSGGEYKVVLTICDDDVESDPLTVVPPTPGLMLPIIIRHPQSTSQFPGDELVLSVLALYATSYQWQKRGASSWENLSGATGPNYEVDDVTPSTAGSYRVIVSNSAGSVTSNVAVVSINCSSWEPFFTLVSGTEYHQRDRLIVAAGSQYQLTIGLSTSTESVIWRVDGQVVAVGSGTRPGIAYTITSGHLVTISVTDGDWHTVGAEVTSAACGQTKTAELFFYGPIAGDFGPLPNPIDVVFTEAIALADDPSIYVEVRNSSFFPASELTMSSIFSAIVSDGMIEVPEVQFPDDELGPDSVGRVKITLSTAGVNAIIAGDDITTEAWQAGWQDIPATGALGMAITGQLRVNATFESAEPEPAGVTVRWGHSTDTVLDEAGILALDFSATQPTIGGDYAFDAQVTPGHYVYIAIPLAGDVPRLVDGIRLSGRAEPFVEADDTLGFTDITAPGGWHCLEVGAWRLFRSAYPLNDPGTIRVSP